MASKWSKTFCPSEVPSLRLAGDISVRNGNYITICNSDRVRSIPYIGSELHSYNTNDNPLNYCQKLPLYIDISYGPCSIKNETFNF